MLRLREAVNQERDLVYRVTKLKQRIYKQINNFCPELNHLLGDLEKAVYRKYLLEHSPLDLSSSEVIESLLRSHRIYSEYTLSRFLEGHSKLRLLGQDRALQEEQLEHLRCLIRILEVTVSELRYCEKRIDGLHNDLPQAAIYRSMPGVGPRLPLRNRARIDRYYSRTAAAPQGQDLAEKSDESRADCTASLPAESVHRGRLPQSLYLRAALLQRPTRTGALRTHALRPGLTNSDAPRWERRTGGCPLARWPPSSSASM